MGFKFPQTLNGSMSMSMLVFGECQFNAMSGSRSRSSMEFHTLRPRPSEYVHIYIYIHSIKLYAVLQIKHVYILHVCRSVTPFVIVHSIVRSTLFIYTIKYSVYNTHVGIWLKFQTPFSLTTFSIFHADESQHECFAHGGFVY